MEPKKTSAQPQPHMESKKSPPRGAAAGGGGSGTAAVGAESPLSSLFHQPSHGAKGKEDLYSILFKGQNGTTQPGTAGNGKSQWTPAKSRTNDSKQSNQYDSVDTSCFGSSVNYGGRDYYGNSGPKPSTESNDYKVDKKDPAKDSHGDWWQGSFYY
ncbi:hypothetical protein GUJ93_ZPchr0007g5778 [Zizania palustris]|uniref:Uncharacterized protein n=1 Tax=Zizania palustris TaxID=103762 RepID=A0A8J5VNB1_ZIZPA|nr:hypothetical protein GUJ93_ZPchr0007g5778 [Zizania palustris]